MKKKVVVLAVACALALSFALAGCGSDSAQESKANDSAEQSSAPEAKDTRTDLAWYKVQIPDGFALDTMNGDDCATVSFSKKTDADKAQIFVDFEHNDTAEAIVKHDLEYWDNRTEGEPVTYNGVQWQTLTYEWNDLPSVDYIAQFGDDAIHIKMLEVAPNDPAAKTFMGSIAFAEDLNKAYNDAFDVKAPV